MKTVEKKIKDDLRQASRKSREDMDALKQQVRSEAKEFKKSAGEALEAHDVEREIRHERILPAVLTTPTRKNSTSNAVPTAFNAPLIDTITFQIVPPLKAWGDCVRSVQISASFSFHILRAKSRLSMIQLPLSNCQFTSFGG